MGIMHTRTSFTLYRQGRWSLACALRDSKGKTGHVSYQRLDMGPTGAARRGRFRIVALGPFAFVLTT